MPASQGMIMLGMMIMDLVGDKDSWDQNSLFQGGMMGGGGMGGGGMGGGMGGGGMGGGGMGGGMGGGGMGGGMRSVMANGGNGFRSVPATGLPSANLSPNQTRHLPTRLVSLRGPSPTGEVVMPAKGERLSVGRIEQLNSDLMAQKALVALAESKAPPVVAQLVLWYVADGFDWATIATYSKGWANPFEQTLAQEFVRRLRETGSDQSVHSEGIMQWELTSRSSNSESIVQELRTALKTKFVLGLQGHEGIDASPNGPAIACRVRVEDQIAVAQLSVSNETGDRWVPAGELTLKLNQTDAGKMTTDALIDRLAEAVLTKLVHVKLVAGPKSKGKASYRIRVENASPMILKGISLTGLDAKADVPPSTLLGITLPPHRSLDLPARAEVIERLKLQKGIELLGIDLGTL